MPWAAVGAIASVGGALLGGANSANAASDASRAQTDSAAQAIAEQRRQFDLTQSNNAPFLKTGTAANSRLATLLGIAPPQGQPGGPSYDDFYKQVYAQSDAAHQAQYGMPLAQSGDTVHLSQAMDNIKAEAQKQYDAANSAWVAAHPAAADPDSGSLLRKFSASDLAADPVYNSGLKFGLDQGTNAINARAIAGGGYDSGATLKALTQFGNDYGSTKANDAYNRYTNDQGNIYNKLAGVSGTGQTAVGTVANAGTNSTNAIANTMTDAGNSRAAGIVGGSNAWGSAAQGVSGAFNSYNSSQLLQKILGNGGGGYMPSNYNTSYFGPNAYSPSPE